MMSAASAYGAWRSQQALAAYQDPRAQGGVSPGGPRIVQPRIRYDALRPEPMGVAPVTVPTAMSEVDPENSMIGGNTVPSSPASIYAEGKFLARGVTERAPGVSTAALDRAFNELKDYFGCADVSRSLIERRFAISSRDIKGIEHIEYAVDWMLETGSFEHEIQKVWMLAPANDVEPYFEDFSLRPKFGPYLRPGQPHPRPGVNDPLTLLYDRWAFDFDGNTTLARALVDRLVGKDPTQVHLDRARGLAHRMLKPGRNPWMADFLNKHLEVVQPPDPNLDGRRYQRQFNAHMKKIGYFDLVQEINRMSKKIARVDAKEASEPDPKNLTEHLQCGKDEEAEVAPFPNSRYTTDKGRVNPLYERIGPQGHHLACEQRPGGFDSTWTGHGGIDVDEHGHVAVARVTIGTAVEQIAHGKLTGGELSEMLQTRSAPNLSNKSPDIRAVVKRNGGIHPSLSDWLTYLPRAWFVAPRVEPPRAYAVFKNNSSVSDPKGKGYEEVVTHNDMGVIVGDHCNRILDSTRLIPPMSLHYLPIVQQGRVTTPGRYMKNPIMTRVVFDQEAGKWREQEPRDWGYVHDWFPAPPTPEDRALELFPRDLENDVYVLLRETPLPD